MKRANQHRKAHSSLLIFLGALTVFVTFVLKEGIAERFKDSVVTLEQAQDIFGLRQEVRSDCRNRDPQAHLPWKQRVATV